MVKVKSNVEAGTTEIEGKMSTFIFCLAWYLTTYQTQKEEKTGYIDRLGKT